MTRAPSTVECACGSRRYAARSCPRCGAPPEGWRRLRPEEVVREGDMAINCREVSPERVGRRAGGAWYARRGAE